jgi:hypothetical protein
MSEEKEKKKGSGKLGCAISLLVIWGLMGMAGGHGFFESILANIKVIVIVGVIGFAIYGYIRYSENN